MAAAKHPIVKNEKTNLPALATMYEEDAGSGFEAADESSYAIPMLTILQALSPQLNKQDGAYIRGAEQGQIINTATQDLADGIKVIPCYFKRSFTHWAPRDSGGGFLGEVSPDDPILAKTERNEKGALALPDGTYFNDTRTHYVLVIDEAGNAQPAVIPMTSTQIKKSKQWMTRMQNLKLKGADGSLFTPPMFAKFFGLSTIPESNNQGSWYGWKIGEAEDVTDPEVYAMARAFRDSIASGQAKAAAPTTAHHDDDIAF